MRGTLRWNTLLLALGASFILSACGGHNGEDTSGSQAATPTQLAAEPGAPVVSNNIATDGFNWFNYRRGQIGLAPLVSNVYLQTAAQKHSDYQKTNDTTTHEEVLGKSGFTGTSVADRMRAAGYVLVSPYVVGEVISSINSSSGFYMADALMTAVGHRFLILQPSYRDAGSASATASNGLVYFTTNLGATNGYAAGLSGVGNVVTYPFANQTNVQPNFLSDQESPDPVAGHNEVGFPISVHANINASLTASTFSVAPRGGGILAVTSFIYDDFNSAVAIVPIQPLTSHTTYDVNFIGTANGILVTRAWSFTTR